MHIIFLLLCIRTPLLAEWIFFFFSVVGLYILSLRVETFHFKIQLITVYLRRDNPSNTATGTYFLYVTFFQGKISLGEGNSPSAGQ